MRSWGGAVSRGVLAVSPLDEDAYAAAFAAHRAELEVHCYRMTGSAGDAEELVQDTFLRAWRHRDRYEGQASMRTWLYRIATNACLDRLRAASRRTRPVGLGGPGGSPLDAMPWLEPIADSVLDRADAAAGPEGTVVARETITLGFVAVLQLLPARQRAALVAHDLAGLSGAETAELLDVPVTAVNSLLQRGRATLREHAGATAAPDDTDPGLLARYVAAHEAGDLDALLALVADDLRLAMPPEPPTFGLAASATVLGEILDPAATGEWRLLPVGANRQPATAGYLRRPGDGRFRAASIDLLTVVDGRITAVDTFLGEHWFARFGLPLTLTP
jgi:RNA polymerase sigma-70 factor (ECF subfamily)